MGRMIAKSVYPLWFLHINATQFESHIKFKLRLKSGWFYLKLYSIFQDLSRRSIETDF